MCSINLLIIDFSNPGALSPCVGFWFSQLHDADTADWFQKNCYHKVSLLEWWFVYLFIFWVVFQYSKVWSWTIPNNIGQQLVSMALYCDVFADECGR